MGLGFEGSKKTKSVQCKEVKSSRLTWHSMRRNVCQDVYVRSGLGKEHDVQRKSEDRCRE